LDPEYFIWTGDAVYTKNNSIKGLARAYAELENSPEYALFRDKTVIHGVWDDHGILVTLTYALEMY
jgi:hypothetical protein